MATTKPGGIYRGTDGKLRDAQGSLIAEPVVTVETPVPAVETAPAPQEASGEPIPANEPIAPITDVPHKPKGKKAK